jgi:hypothetical protein
MALVRPTEKVELGWENGEDDGRCNLPLQGTRADELSYNDGNGRLWWR